MTMSLTGGGSFTLNSVDMTISWYDSNPSEVITVNGNPITLIQGLQTYNLNLTGTFSFTGTDGQNPNGGLILDSAGNVYGTTYDGGSGGGWGTGSDLARGRASQPLVSAETGTGVSQVVNIVGFDAAWDGTEEYDLAPGSTVILVPPGATVPS